MSAVWYLADTELVVMQVNPVREKKLTNVRNTGSEEKVNLSPPRLFTLEDAIGTCETCSSLGQFLNSFACLHLDGKFQIFWHGCFAGYVAEDELIEVTPSKIRYARMQHCELIFIHLLLCAVCCRLRKRILDSSARKSLKRRAA